ncbi:MAG: anti-sigma factor [Chloroflexota bacterium]
MADASDPPDTHQTEPSDPDDRPTARMEVGTPHDTLDAYVRGALNADERRTFELHLFVCLACRANLAARTQARGRVDVSEAPTVVVPRVTSGASLAGAQGDESPTIIEVAPTLVMPAAVVGAAQPRADAAGAGHPQTGGTAAVQAPAAPPAGVLAPPPRRQGARIKLASVGWGIALLFTIAAGLFYANWSATAPHPSFELELLSRLPGGQLLALRGTVIPSASARLYVVDNGRRAELTVDALPPLLPGRVYQLWFAEPNQPARSGGTFGVDPRGDTAVRVTVPTPLERVREVAITQEPAPGSPAPTGVQLLAWNP